MRAVRVDFAAMAGVMFLCISFRFLRSDTVTGNGRQHHGPVREWARGARRSNPGTDVIRDSRIAVKSLFRAICNAHEHTGQCTHGG